MRLPQKKKKGDAILAEDWNLLLDAIAARTPRPGDGLKFISSSGGFAYAAPKPLDALPGQPPFSVIGIAKSGGGYKVTIKEGWVIERQPKTGSKPAVKFHMPEYGGKALDSIPKPEIQMSFGDTLWCRVQTDDEGIITGKPQIIVSSSDKDGNHYYPEDPQGSGGPGDCYVKLLKLENDGGVPRVKVYQQSDIEHWAQLWTGQNVGYHARVYKEHKEDENIYKFRTIKGTSPIHVTEQGDVIDVSIDPDYPPPPPYIPPEYAETGSLTFLDCDGVPIEGKKIEWEDGLVKTAGDITIEIPPCDEYGGGYGGEGITGATGELIIRSDRPDLTYPDNIVGYVKAENGIVTEIFGDVLVCCHPDTPS